MVRTRPSPGTWPTRRTAASWSTSRPSSAAPGCWSTTRARWARARCPRFADLDPATYLRLLEVNLVAPLALTAALLPQLRRHAGVVLNISSDAAVEAYETWGGYGSAKAGLDHASRVLAAEEPRLRVYAVDPGDMRTQMHQDAFPGEDISDRPEPRSVVPALLQLVDGDLPGGRYRAVRPRVADPSRAGVA